MSEIERGLRIRAGDAAVQVSAPATPAQADQVTVIIAHLMAVEDFDAAVEARPWHVVRRRSDRARMVESLQEILRRGDDSARHLRRATRAYRVLSEMGAT